jgi:tape measure domain-containing protein
MLGSAERARNLLQQITEFSNATPFTPEEVTESARSLMAMGVSADNLMTTMRMVGDVASGVGMNFNELAQIWGKNLASGTVQMEDLNQLAGRGIPIMKELSKVFFGNENQVQQVRELSSRGQISFRHLEQAFRNMTSQGGQYFGMLDRQSRTAIGLWSTLTGNVDETKRQIGMMLMEALKPLLELLVKLTSWLVNTRWAMAALKVIFLAAIPIIIGIAVALGKSLIPAIIASTAAFWKMAVATIAATWPFMLIAAAIIALILIIEDLYVWIQGGDSLIGQWLGSFSEFGTKVKGIFINLWEKIKSIFLSVINFFREKGKYFVMAIFPVNILYFYWDQIAAFFRALPGRIVDFFTSIPNRLTSALSGLGVRIRDALRGLLPNWAINLIARVSGPSTPIAVEARASGGPVSPGRAYIVGEEGPELFTPSQSGYIVPSVSLAGNGRNIVIAPVLNFNAPVRREDAEYVRDVVSRVLAEIASRIEGGVRAGLGLEVG